MVNCCQKASLFQEWVLKVQTLFKEFLHPRFPVADSQEKAVIEWCSNRNNLGCCCKRGTQNRESLGCCSCGLCTSFTRLAHTSVWSGDFQSHIWSRCVPSWILSQCPCCSCDTCNHPGDDHRLFQAPAELGRSHRAAVWPQLWEGICRLLLCPQHLGGLGIIWCSQCLSRN